MRIVTIRDVAKEAQVSISTVSRVLNDRPDVDALTRARVLKVVEKLQYVRNANAANLKQQHTDFSAVVLRGRRNLFLTDLSERILDIGRRRGRRFLIEIIDEKDDEFETARTLYRERKLSGCIFLGSNLQQHVHDFETLDLPCVFATVQAEFLAGRQFSSVAVNNFDTGKAAVDRLIGLGHRRIALLGFYGPVTNSTGQRLYGAQESLRRHGIPYDESLFEECDFTLPSAYAGMTAVLSRRRDFSALFAISDIVAFGAMKALIDHGLSVPRDVSVIGMDGTEQAAYTVPSLSTYAQPADDIATESVRLLEAAMRGQKGKHVLLPAPFIQGGSIKKHVE